MGHFHLFLPAGRVQAGHHQARVGQPLDQGHRLRGLAPRRHQLGQAHPAACVAALSAGRRILQAGQTQKDVAHPRLPLPGQAQVYLVGRMGDRLPDAADGPVLLPAQPAPVPPLPQQQQRVLQQGHGPRLALHVVQDRLAQPGLEAQPYVVRLALHGAAQGGGVHRRYQLLVLLHLVLEVRESSALPPEISAHGDHDPAAIR